MTAPKLLIQTWLNGSENFQLDLNAPRIKVIHAFQMLCPGCVYHGIPQTVELFHRLKGLPVDVVGLHTVFEHHNVMTVDALKVFIKEWQLPFPVGVDEPSIGDRIPKTMKAYEIEGTPTTIVIDQLGNRIIQHFGTIETEKFYNFILELTKKIRTQNPA